MRTEKVIKEKLQELLDMENYKSYNNANLQAYIDTLLWVTNELSTDEYEDIIAEFCEEDENEEDEEEDEEDEEDE